MPAASRSRPAAGGRVGPHPRARVRRRRLVGPRRRRVLRRVGRPAPATGWHQEASRCRSPRSRRAPRPALRRRPLHAGRPLDRVRPGVAPMRARRPSSATSWSSLRADGSAPPSRAREPAGTSSPRPASAATAASWRGSPGTTLTCRGTAPTCGSATSTSDDGGLRLEGARQEAGGREESLVQPEWGRHGDLFVISDRSGWWNVHRVAGQGQPRERRPPSRRGGAPDVGVR